MTINNSDTSESTLESIVRTLRSPIGAWGTIRDRFFVPQVGVFSLLILLSSIRHDSLEALIPKLLILILLVVEYLLVRTRIHYAHFGALGIHLFVTTSILILFGLTPGNPVIYGVFLPISLSYTALFVLRIPWKVSTAYAVLAMGMLLVYAHIIVDDSAGQSERLVSGLWFTAQVLISVVALSFVRGKDGKSSDQNKPPSIEGKTILSGEVLSDPLEILTDYAATLLKTRRVLQVKAGQISLYRTGNKGGVSQGLSVMEGISEFLRTTKEVAFEARASSFSADARKCLGEWFMVLPRYFIVVSLPGRFDEWLLLPSYGFFGWRRHRSLKLLIAVTRLVHEREALRRWRDDATEFEQEFDSAVHEVNNAAQELFGIAEEERASQQLFNEVLKRGLSSMSWIVSDTRVLRELLRNNASAAPREVLSLEAIESELRTFAEWINARQKGGEVLVSAPESKVLREVLVEVRGKEYLLSVLRFLMLQGARSGAPTLRVLLSFDEKRIGIRCAGGSSNLLNPRTVRYGEAFARINEGEFKCSTYLGINQYIALSLHRGVGTPAVTNGRVERWVLILEDSESGALLCKRAVEALGSLPRVGRSNQEARELIKKYGKPSAVLADVNLSDGESTSLLLNLQQECDGTMPILIISGTVVDVGSLRSGSNKVIVLQKPVARKVLLENIQEILQTPIWRER